MVRKKKKKKVMPPRFKHGQRIALDTCAGEVLGEIVESDSSHGIMVSDLDNTVRYRIPHGAIKFGKIRFL